MIATSNPRQEPIKPPREPVNSSAKKHVSAAPDRTMIRNARCSFVLSSSNSRIDENPNDCCNDEKAEQDHRIAPAPMNVAAVLWLMKDADRDSREAGFGAHNNIFGER